MIKPYESEEAEREFDKKVNLVVWFGIICLAVGIILTHYTLRGGISNG